ncbi:uncharacterized protein [Aristolochia californica]|uniref:uncharacterized protein n=1 Tax=Aristolochia californica TaxID=171875 RepID=UPI0035E33ABC
MATTPFPSRPCYEISSISSILLLTQRPWGLFIILLNLCPFGVSISSPYSLHCNSIVPESISNGLSVNKSFFPSFKRGYFTGGELILSDDPQSTFTSPKSVRLVTTRLTETSTQGLLKIDATLYFRGGSIYGTLLSNQSRLYADRIHRTTAPRLYHQRGRTTFDLHGFWSAPSGKLCLLGMGSSYSKDGNFLDLHAVVKLNYAMNSTITTSLVTGTVESLDGVDSMNYFDKISVFALSDSSYRYTLTTEAKTSCSAMVMKENSVSLGKYSSVCSLRQRLYRGFQLEYPSNCAAQKCSPFDGFLPRFMSIGVIQCSDGEKVHLKFQFYNSTSFAYKYRPLAPKSTWVSEGIWDGEKNRLCLVACPLMNFTNSFINVSTGDCSIRLSLHLPAVLTLQKRSVAVGSIWSIKDPSAAGYFERIDFQSLDKQYTQIAGQRYEYTQTDRLKKLCQKKDVTETKGKRYPGIDSFGVMSFDFSLQNTQKSFVWGSSYLLKIGDSFYPNPVTLQDVFEEGHVTPVQNPAVKVLNSSQNLFNVSYAIRFTTTPYFKWGRVSTTEMSSDSSGQVDISAEGLYDVETGDLCMVGCHYLYSNGQNSTMDCDILVKVQFPPLNSSTENLRGSIRSTRDQLDPFYFEPLKMSSKEVIGSLASDNERVDFEIAMVLISLTLACIFTVLQLLHVKRNLDVLPSMSLLMLLVLTLGHMIPLVLNFEAFFKNSNRQNVMTWSDGWLEGNEVIVRVVTMIAFLLQFRLLQLTWSARLSGETNRKLWMDEKKAVYLCLSLYTIGGLISGIIHFRTSGSSRPKFHGFARPWHSIWEDLRSYCGLVLDGFLLPQILLNVFVNSNQKVLAPSFYAGATIVRLLPHAYDAYRSHHYASHVPYVHFRSSFIYANPSGDLYSTAWDVIIPCGGLLFAVILFLQQRYGGACVLPRRLRQSLEYGKVSVVVV